MPPPALSSLSQVDRLRLVYAPAQRLSTGQVLAPGWRARLGYARWQSSSTMTMTMWVRVDALVRTAWPSPAVECCVSPSPVFRVLPDVRLRRRGQHDRRRVSPAAIEVAPSRSVLATLDGRCRAIALPEEDWCRA